MVEPRQEDWRCKQYMDDQIADVQAYIDAAIAAIPSASTLHNDLGGLQGGTATERYHLDSADYDDIIKDRYIRADGTIPFYGDVEVIASGQIDIASQSTPIRLIYADEVRSESIYINGTNIKTMILQSGMT